MDTKLERKKSYIFLYTRYALEKISVVEKLFFFSDVYYTYISATITHIIVNQKFTYYIKFVVGKTGWVIPDLLWCENRKFNGFVLKNQKILQSNNFCVLTFLNEVENLRILVSQYM